MKRSGSAVWHGSGKEGSGQLTTTSGALSAQPYSTKLRFEDEDGRAGTNPEELIAAAHAGCFSMAASFALTAAGHVPEELRTTAEITLEQQQSGGFAMTKVVLSLDARVPGISDEDFHRIAAQAKANCPVSKALSLPIELEARLHR
jgi:lipoyl-dependent peroxiredoxin